MERVNLKVFRIRQKLTQGEMAQRIGCDRSTYAAVERGERDGSMRFWRNLFAAFPDDITDAMIGELMKIE